MNTISQESSTNEFDPLNISFSHEKAFEHSTPSDMSSESPEITRNSSSIIIRNPR